MIQYSFNNQFYIFKRYKILWPIFNKKAMWYFQINYKFLKIKSIILIFLFIFFYFPTNCNFQYKNIIFNFSLLFFYLPFLKFLNYN